jgi:hypothetical protein
MGVGCVPSRQLKAAPTGRSGPWGITPQSPYGFGRCPSRDVPLLRAKAQNAGGAARTLSNSDLVATPIKNQEENHG